MPTIQEEGEMEEGDTDKEAGEDTEEADTEEAGAKMEEVEEEGVAEEHARGDAREGIKDHLHRPHPIPKTPHLNSPADLPLAPATATFTVTTMGGTPPMAGPPLAPTMAKPVTL